MLRRPVVTALVLFAFVSSSAPAADDTEIVQARAEFDRLQRWTPSDTRSLAGTLHDLLSRDPEVVLRVESEAWDARLDPRRIAGTQRQWAAVEDTIRLLHAIPSPTANRSPSPNPQPRPRRCTFDEFVKGRGLREPPSLRAADLFAAAADPKSAEPTGLLSLGIGEPLGEACATDDEAFTELCRRAAATPDHPLLVTALGWSERPKAVEILAARVAALANAREAELQGPSAAREVVAALAHADRTRLDRLLDGMAPPVAELLASCIAPDAVIVRRLDAVHRAGVDAAARQAALAALVRPIPSGARPPRGAEAQRLVSALFDAMDSGGPVLRDAASAFATQFFNGWDREDLHDERLGTRWSSFCEPREFLRLLSDDLAAGRMEFVREEPSLLSPAPPAPWACRGTAGADRAGDAPVELTGERTRDGVLHLRLRNTGRTPVALDTAALHYGWAERYGTETGETGHPKPFETVLALKLHGVGRIVVRTDALVTLAPGATHEWRLVLRSELRPTDHVDIEIDDDVPIVGDSAVPVVTFARARVF